MGNKVSDRNERRCSSSSVASSSSTVASSSSTVASSSYAVAGPSTLLAAAPHSVLNQDNAEVATNINGGLTNSSLHMNNCDQVFCGVVTVYNSSPGSGSTIQSVTDAVDTPAILGQTTKCNLWRLLCDRRAIVLVMVVCVITAFGSVCVSFWLINVNNGNLNYNTSPVTTTVTSQTSVQLTTTAISPPNLPTSTSSTESTAMQTTLSTATSTQSTLDSTVNPTQSSTPQPKPIKMKLRSDWRALPPKNKSKELSGAIIKRIIIAHTNGASCSQECSQRVREIQMENAQLNDIPYNYLIGDDGFVYEGLGEEFQGEHTSTLNGSSFNDIGICVAFIGTFEDQRPSEVQLDTFDNFIRVFVSIGKIDKEYKIFSQDQLRKMNETGALRAAVKEMNEQRFYDGE